MDETHKSSCLIHTFIQTKTFKNAISKEDEDPSISILRLDYSLGLIL